MQAALLVRKKPNFMPFPISIIPTTLRITEASVSPKEKNYLQSLPLKWGHYQLRTVLFALKIPLKLHTIPNSSIYRHLYIICTVLPVLKILTCLAGACIFNNQIITGASYVGYEDMNFHAFPTSINTDLHAANTLLLPFGGRIKDVRLYNVTLNEPCQWTKNYCSSTVLVVY